MWIAVRNSGRTTAISCSSSQAPAGWACVALAGEIIASQHEQAERDLQPGRRLIG
jgi:hypothetical protein